MNEQNVGFGCWQTMHIAVSFCEEYLRIQDRYVYGGIWLLDSWDRK